MKKNSFIEGTIIATISILIVRAIGIVYVIPFNAIIGERGGALYGYAYNIYQLFLSISSAGFPFAISKITSEYNALGYKRSVYDTYKLAIRIISGISVVIFLILMIFAPQIAMVIVGSSTGGNTIDDIAFVIRMVSFAILIVPFLSVTRGLLQGHKYITPYSVSQIIEQVVRVLVILIGSYLCVKVFNLPLRYAVGIAVSGAFFGGVFSYIYLKVKVRKSKILNDKKNKGNVVIGNKDIVKKIFSYSIPFILISLVNNLYITIDMVLLSRTLYGILGVGANIGESIVGVYTTWGVKLNNIILAVSTGLVTSLIPNIVSSNARSDIKDVNDKFNKAIQCVLLVIVPMTLFLSMLVKPVWTLFYGNSYYGPLVYKFFVYTALFGGVYTIIVNTLQGLNKYKLVMKTVLMGLVVNAILDIPLMLLANKIGFNASYGAIMAAIIGYCVSIYVSIHSLKKEYNFSYNSTLSKLPNFIVSWFVFVVIIFILKLFVPTNLENRLIQVPIIMLFGIVSFGIYIVINYKNGNLNEILSIDLNKLFKKVKKSS